MGKLEDQLKELEKVRKRGLLTDDEYQAKRSSIIHDPTNLSVRNRGGGGAGGGIFKWGLLGCLAIFAAIGAFFVFVLVLIGVALSSIGSDSKDVTVTIAGTPASNFREASVRSAASVPSMVRRHGRSLSRAGRVAGYSRRLSKRKSRLAI